MLPPPPFQERLPPPLRTARPGLCRTVDKGLLLRAVRYPGVWSAKPGQVLSGTWPQRAWTRRRCGRDRRRLALHRRDSDLDGADDYPRWRPAIPGAAAGRAVSGDRKMRNVATLDGLVPHRPSPTPRMMTPEDYVLPADIAFHPFATKPDNQ